MRRSLKGLALMVALFFVVGCGGTGGGEKTQVVAPGTGRIAIRVAWPATTRVIPDGTVKIRLELRQGGKLLIVKDIPRDETYTELSDIPTGTVQLSGTAVAADGSVLAAGNTNLEIKLAETTDANLTLSADGAPTFDYPTFQPGHSLSLIDEATVVDGKLRLVPATSWGRGAAWHPIRQSVANGFETTFRFRITEGGGGGAEPGADGFAFVIQNAGLDAIGDDGQGIGYHGIANSLAIEFDTYPNGDYDDPNNNHIAIQTRGTDENSADHGQTLGVASDIPAFSDGEVHTARVKYAEGRIQVFLDGAPSPVLNVPLDLATTLSLHEGTAYVGFTAATATSYENEEIHSWSFTAR